MVAWWAEGNFQQGTHCQTAIYPSKFGEWLKDAYKLRAFAHYSLNGAGVKETRKLLQHAREFVSAIKEVVSR